MICADAVSTEPKMNATASGSLVQPKPVVNSIALPATQFAHTMRRYRCKIMAHAATVWKRPDLQNNEPTGRAGRRAPDDERLHDGVRRGWRPERVAEHQSIGPELRSPLVSPSADAGHLWQMNGAAECLLDQVKSVDQHTHADQPVSLELGELRDAQANRLVGIQCCE